MRKLALLAALLASTARGDFAVKQGGAHVGTARDINCGTNMTCSISGVTATLSSSGSGGSGAPVDGGFVTFSGGTTGSTNERTLTAGTNIAISTATPGQVSIGVTGTVASATSATSATTAASLAGNPTDCSANQYATAIDTAGNLTCAQVTGGQVSGAVATATALASNPTDCGANTYATAIDASGNLTCSTPPGAGTKYQVTGSNYTNSTTSPSTILSWSVTSGVEFGFHCVLLSTGTATSLIRYNISGPATTHVAFTTQRFTTTSAQTLLVLQAFSAAAQTAACTSSCNTTILPTEIWGAALPSANGTVAVQGTSSTSGQTVTVHRGSFCEVF